MREQGKEIKTEQVIEREYRKSEREGRERAGGERERDKRMQCR